MKHRVVIVGGGFGGISCARTLAKKHLPNLKITLISDKSYFEYLSGLYRAGMGRSSREVCIPLSDILNTKKVECVKDKILSVDPQKRVIQGESAHYEYDSAIFALGSQGAYFDIPGIKNFAFAFKTITDAVRLKQHLLTVFRETSARSDDFDQDRIRMHFIVVGAGASGVELAGELAVYVHHLAQKHGIDPHLITIDLIESANRILPAFRENFSHVVEKRIRDLSINIFSNRSMIQEELHGIMLKDMDIKSETVVWTAGTKPNSLYHSIKGLSFDTKGRVIVDPYLRAKGYDTIYIVGDGASTQYSGMAQTAIRDGKTVAKNIIRLQEKKVQVAYRAKKPYYAIPVGSGWAAALVGPFQFFGKIGWCLRRMADLRFFLSILPIQKALLVFRSGKTVCEACMICK